MNVWVFAPCLQKKRRKLSIEDGRDQLVSLREGVRGLQTAVAADGRPALEATVKGAIEKVPSCVRVCMRSHQ